MYPRKYVIVIVNDLELAILFDAVLEHRDFCNCNRHPAGATADQSGQRFCVFDAGSGDEP